MKILRYDNPRDARDEVREYLARDPLRNNVVLTLLESRVVDPLPGRYWAVLDDPGVVGIGIQTPLDRPIVLSVMSQAVAAVLASAIGAEIEEVPGVSGEAAAAARFAGEWAACRKIAARPTAGRRLYEAREIRDRASADGYVEEATFAHEALAYEWVMAFSKEIGEQPQDPKLSRKRIAAGLVRFWNDNGLRSMAFTSTPLFGCSRLQYVYTPPQHRGLGYAESLVREVSRRLLSDRIRPILITNLADPGANGVYQRVGYEAAAEMVVYRFDPPAAGRRE